MSVPPSNIGAWRRKEWTESDIMKEFNRILKEECETTREIQQILSRRLNISDGHALREEMTVLDGYMFFIGRKLADANALLDIAEKFYRIPAGRSQPCTTEDGVVVGERGRRKKSNDEEFTPKYKELTDADRNIDLAGIVVPFRRLRDEFEVIHESLVGRLFRAKDILEDLRVEAKASGLADSAGRGRSRHGFAS